MDAFAWTTQRFSYILRATDSKLVRVSFSLNVIKYLIVFY